jgi:hypothetical protein
MTSNGALAELEFTSLLFALKKNQVRSEPSLSEGYRLPANERNGNIQRVLVLDVASISVRADRPSGMWIDHKHVSRLGIVTSSVRTFYLSCDVLDEMYNGTTKLWI